MYEVSVEGWRRAFDGVKEFISFRINLKPVDQEGESGGKIIRVEKRYSELYKFHKEVNIKD